MGHLGPWLPDRKDLPPIAIAVSGGGDSLCLAWLAAHWRRNLLAFVVDHGLRTASAEEAQLTLSRLAAMGVPARLLTLTTLQKGSGMAERARMARYAILAQACQEAGCIDLLLGHQADDQAETVAMRQRAQSGPDGLAGMAWVTPMAAVRLVRPLLGFSRVALRRTLREQGLTWVDDPSNEDRKAERVRVRHHFAQDPALRSACWQLAARQGVARMDRQEQHAQVLAHNAALLPMGWACLGPKLPDVDVVAGLVRAVAGLAYPPSREGITALCQQPKGGTLCGAHLVPHQGQWFILRELAAQQNACPLQNGLIWDQRFTVTFPSGFLSAGLSIAAAGYGIPRAMRKGWPARFCATLPALWRAGQRVAIPHLEIWTEPPLRQVEVHFCPPVPVCSGSLYGAVG